MIKKVAFFAICVPAVLGILLILLYGVMHGQGHAAEMECGQTLLASGSQSDFTVGFHVPGGWACVSPADGGERRYMGYWIR